MKRTSRIVVFGSTGTAGAGAIQACLDDPQVGEVRAVTRRALGFAHPKLREVHCEDFADLNAISSELQGVDACLFCLGVSATIVRDEQRYREIHVGYALAAAKAVSEQSSEARFVYLSGEGAKKNSRMMWARVKAEAETKLAESFPTSISARPGYIHPMHPRGLKRWLLGPLFLVLPLLGIRSRDLGRAMLALGRAAVAVRSPVGNMRLRRLGESTPHRRIRRGLKLLMAFLISFILFVGVQVWTPMGKAPDGDRLTRMRNSPNWGGGRFVNPVPERMSNWDALKELMFGESGKTVPTIEIPTTKIDPEMFATAPVSGLRVTWLGHSTLLIELDGRRFLTDPVWGVRASPLTWAGPKRWYPPVISVEDLPALDAVVISHDHYDHLDYRTILKMRDWDTTFVVPLGVGAHLEYWGVSEEKIVELDWWEKHAFGDVDVVATPARHFSGRGLTNRHRTLWCGYAFRGPRHRAFFSGDTAMFPGLTEIGSRLGPFDVTMLDAGAYAQSWADVHLGPEQTVEAHTMLRGRVLLPVHWGLFNLAPHGWTEPIERVLVAAQQAGIEVVAPRPGDSLDPGSPEPVERWWPEIPWRTADEYPIRSSK